MSKLKLIKITLLIIILAEEIRSVERKQIIISEDSNRIYLGNTDNYDFVYKDFS